MTFTTWDYELMQALIAEKHESDIQPKMKKYLDSLYDKIQIEKEKRIAEVIP